MRFDVAVDEYVRDQWGYGHFRSPRTEASYRRTLELLGDQVSNRDPSKVGRDDIKRLLDRWGNPSTRKDQRAHLVAFFKWAMGEGYCVANPAAQTPTVKAVPKPRYRLNEAEVLALLDACVTVREVRAIYLGVFGGLRNQELRGMRGQNFSREGHIWVPASIGKGARERWVPVIEQLAPVVAGIRAEVAADEYVLCAERWRNPPKNTERESLTRRPTSPQALRSLVRRVAERAGVPGAVTVHGLRHFCADLYVNQKGVYVAQQVLGHADIGTTQVYLSKLSADRLREAAMGVRLGDTEGYAVAIPEKTGRIPSKATTGLEPV